jgi:hypothetical protein
MPHCIHCSKVAEFRCACCSGTYYCTRACQQQDWHHMHQYEKTFFVEDASTNAAKPKNIELSKEMMSLFAEWEKTRAATNERMRLNEELWSRKPMGRLYMRMTDKQRKEMKILNRTIFNDPNEEKKRRRDQFYERLMKLIDLFKRIPNQDGTPRKIQFTDIEEARVVVLLRKYELHHQNHVHMLLTKNDNDVIEVTRERERLEDEERRIVHDILMSADVDYDSVVAHTKKIQYDAMNQQWVDTCFDDAVASSKKSIKKLIEMNAFDDDDEKEENLSLGVSAFDLAITITTITAITTLLSVLLGIIGFYIEGSNDKLANEVYDETKKEMLVKIETEASGIAGSFYQELIAIEKSEIVKKRMMRSFLWSIAFAVVGAFALQFIGPSLFSGTTYENYSNYIQQIDLRIIDLNGLQVTESLKNMINEVTKYIILLKTNPFDAFGADLKTAQGFAETQAGLLVKSFATQFGLMTFGAFIFKLRGIYEARIKSAGTYEQYSAAWLINKGNEKKKEYCDLIINNKDDAEKSYKDLKDAYKEDYELCQELYDSSRIDKELSTLAIDVEKLEIGIEQKKSATLKTLTEVKELLITSAKAENNVVNSPEILHHLAYMEYGVDEGQKKLLANRNDQNSFSASLIESTKFIQNYVFDMKHKGIGLLGAMASTFTTLDGRTALNHLLSRFIMFATIIPKWWNEELVIPAISYVVGQFAKFWEKALKIPGQDGVHRRNALNNLIDRISSKNGEIKNIDNKKELHFNLIGVRNDLVDLFHDGKLSSFDGALIYNAIATKKKVITETTEFSSSQIVTDRFNIILQSFHADILRSFSFVKLANLFYLNSFLANKALFLMITFYVYMNIAEFLKPILENIPGIPGLHEVFGLTDNTAWFGKYFLFGCAILGLLNFLIIDGMKWFKKTRTIISSTFTLAKSYLSPWFPSQQWNANTSNRKTLAIVANFIMKHYEYVTTMEYFMVIVALAIYYAKLSNCAYPVYSRPSMNSTLMNNYTSAFNQTTQFDSANFQFSCYNSFKNILKNFPIIG